jgi:hypothetical protein
VQTELAYVTEQLKRVGHAGWEAISKKTGVPIRTIKRIGYDEAVKAPRADTTGKLAMYFRIKEKRKAA